MFEMEFEVEIDGCKNRQRSSKKGNGMAKKFYAVKKGKKTGVFYSWDACKAQVDGFSGAVYKSFPTLEEAQAFANGSPAFSGNAKTMEAVLEHPDDEDMVAYVDGSYDATTKEFSYGAVIAYEGEEYHFSEKVDDTELAEMRNVAGEIKGAEFAMRFALDKGCKRIYIYHDYEGIAKWCLGEWKANKKGTRDYQLFYNSVKDQLEVIFVKVKGHSNDKYNDIADLLAKKALGLD